MRTARAQLSKSLASAAAAVTAPQERIFKLPPAMQLASMMMNLPENYKKNVLDAFRRSGQTQITPEQASSVKSAIKFWEQQRQQPPRRRAGRILSLTDETVHPMVREVQKQLSPKKFRISQRVKDKKLLQADQKKSEDWEEVVEEEEKKKTPVKRKRGRPRKTEAEKAAAAAAKALIPKKPRGRPRKKVAEEKKPAAASRVNKRKRRKDEDELLLQKYMKEDDDDSVFDAKKKSYTISKRDKGREQFYSV